MEPDYKKLWYNLRHIYENSMEKAPVNSIEHNIFSLCLNTLNVMERAPEGSFSPNFSTKKFY